MNILFTDQAITEYYTVSWSIGAPVFRVLPFQVHDGSASMEIYQDEPVDEIRLEMIPTFEQAHQVATDLLRKTDKRVQNGELD